MLVVATRHAHHRFCRIYEELMVSAKVKKAFKDLVDSIGTGQHEAFTAIGLRF